jgi:single-stranded DNA-binding protein
VLSGPELRTTPAGTAVLRLVVDCTNGGNRLTIPVVMTGEAALDANAKLKPGSEIRVEGALRAIQRRLGSGLMEQELEVMASRIERQK